MNIKDPKPCPWCNEDINNEEFGLKFEQKPKGIHVSCSCGISGPYHISNKEAIEAWNIMVNHLNNGINKNKTNFW